ncbi:hypothetical protein [uncultured Methanobrevibacter sp.]|uniref:hypothetical protein n=1 Tax=uncultured Methanobrevibacter sp. TaxID=253161 RepID=UPI0025F23FFC|nr:hypothetical protein [uncultured Methanobrevibacter sp.]
MKKENITPEIMVIKEAFDEERNIIDYAPPEMIAVSDNCHQGGDIFITEEGDLIDLEYQFSDFDEEELAKYVELAEELYEKNEVPITIYVICSNQVLVPEIPIKSDAVFNIKLACINDNPAYDILYQIKEKVNKNISLDDEDLVSLLTIPIMVPKKDRKNIRIECFKLIRQAYFQS